MFVLKIAGTVFFIQSLQGATADRGRAMKFATTELALAYAERLTDLRGRLAVEPR